MQNLVSIVYILYIIYHCSLFIAQTPTSKHVLVIDLIIQHLPRYDLGINFLVVSPENECGEHKDRNRRNGQSQASRETNRVSWSLLCNENYKEAQRLAHLHLERKIAVNLPFEATKLAEFPIPNCTAVAKDK